jgi:hypothetical protein
MVAFVKSDYLIDYTACHFETNDNYEAATLAKNESDK